MKLKLKYMPYEKIIQDTETGKFLKSFNSNDPTKSHWDVDTEAQIFTSQQDLDDTISALDTAYGSTGRFIGQNPPPR